MRVRRSLLVAVTVAATTVGLLAVTVPTTSAAPGKGLSQSRREGAPPVLRSYARATWRSFVAMVDPHTGLPSDNIGGDLAPKTRSAFTSPTNIGAYMWSTVVARDLGFIGRDEARSRL